MKLKIIQVGKTKHDFLQKGIEEYLKKLSFYIEVEVLTLKDEQEKEMAEIEKAKKAGQIIVILDEKGETMNSWQLAKWWQEKMNEGQKGITILIGGAYGLKEEIKGKADLLLSFSKFTFTHEMIRLILLEQLFRVQNILKNSGYHH